MTEPHKANTDIHVSGGFTWDDQTGYHAIGFISSDGERVSGVDTTNGSIHIATGDTASSDAFGRLRVSQQNPLYISKNTHSKHDSQWEELTSGGTETITWLKDEVAVELKVGTASGEYAIRQTDRPAPYSPGSSMLDYITGVLGIPKENVTRRIGVFYDEDGPFFELASFILSVVVRSSVTGSIVDNAVPQSSWNKDKLDGTGISGITVDPSKSQLFYIDYQHLGVGRVRFGFEFNGIIHICHEFDFQNVIDTAYMARATLPARYEIRNTGISASASTMKEICVGIYREGGQAAIGLEYSKGNGTALITGVTTQRTIFAIRLKDTVLAAPNDKPNRMLARLLSANFWAEDKSVYFEVFHVHSPTSITATWADVDDSSSVEFSRDISAFTSPHSHEIFNAYVPAGAAGKGQASGLDTENSTEHTLIHQNFTSDNSHVFIVTAQSISGVAAKAAVSLAWVEYE